MNVHFDDMEVQIIEAPAVNGTDYYPFGLVMDGRSWSSEPYRFGYQGQFSEYDKETGWNAFELRQYNSVIGRWMIVDPYRQHFSPYLGMGNSPILFYDRNGGYVGDDGGKEVIKRDNNWNEERQAYVLDDVVEVTAFRIFDGPFGRVVDSWERKGYTIYDRTTFGRLNLNWYKKNLPDIPDGLGISLTGMTPDGGISFSLDRVITEGDGLKDLYLSVGYGYGLDVSVDGHVTNFVNKDNKPILSTDIEGANSFYGVSGSILSYHKSYSINDKGIGNTVGTSIGLQCGPTTPFILNGYGGVGYTFNLSKQYRSIVNLFK